MQASSQNKFGILHVSHIYKPSNKLLSVEIVSGENLQALEQSGNILTNINAYAF